MKAFQVSFEREDNGTFSRIFCFSIKPAASLWWNTRKIKSLCLSTLSHYFLHKEDLWLVFYSSKNDDNDVRYTAGKKGKSVSKVMSFLEDKVLPCSWSNIIHLLFRPFRNSVIWGAKCWPMSYGNQTLSKILTNTCISPFLPTWQICSQNFWSRLK